VGLFGSREKQRQYNKKAFPMTDTPTSSARARPVPDSGERLIPIDDVMTRVGVCRTTLYHLIKSGAFNPPVKIGRSSRWLASEVDAFVRAAAASRPELATPASS
jgi:prophage regulatory protein